MQEMIDIGDFASACRGSCMAGPAFRATGHRMYEQYQPWAWSASFGFQFPGCGLGRNAFSLVSVATSHLEPSPKTPLSAIASLKICTRPACRRFPDIFFLFNDAGNQNWRRISSMTGIPLISFTVSTHVGRLVGKRVAQRLGRSCSNWGQQRDHR